MHCDDDVDPKQELEHARAAVAEGDLAHAMHHLATALAHDPTWDDALALLQDVRRGCEDPLGTVPLSEDEPTYFGTVALRAKLLAEGSQPDEGLELLADVVRQQQRPEYLAWVQEWLARPGWAESLAPERLGAIAVCAIADLGAEGHARLADVLARLRAVQPGAPLLAHALLIALRKSGDVAGAIQRGEALRREAPSYGVLSGLAAAQRDAGLVEEALATTREALTLPHDDEVGPRLDIGDMLLELERWSEAQASYEEALRYEPDQPWALGSLPYCALRRDRDPAALERLLLAAEAGNDRAAELLEELAPTGPPGSSVLNAVRQAVARGGAMTRVLCTSLEPPSAILAARSLHEATGHDSPFEVSFGEVPDPDPRAPWAPLEHPALWRYHGTDAAPAVASPPPPAAREIEVASLEPTVEGLRRLGARLAPPEAAVDALLRGMVHPPPAPEELEPGEWLYRVQQTCAAAIALLDADWQAVRLPALRSLLHGPVDWTTTAAIRALDLLARCDPSLQESIDSELLALLEGPLSPIWYQCATQPVASCLLRRWPHERWAPLLDLVLH